MLADRQTMDELWTAYGESAALEFAHAQTREHDRLLGLGVRHYCQLPTYSPTMAQALDVFMGQVETSISESFVDNNLTTEVPNYWQRRRLVRLRDEIAETPETFAKLGEDVHRNMFNTAVSPIYGDVYTSWQQEAVRKMDPVEEAAAIDRAYAAVPTEFPGEPAETWAYFNQGERDRVLGDALQAYLRRVEFDDSRTGMEILLSEVHKLASRFSESINEDVPGSRTTFHTASSWLDMSHTNLASNVLDGVRCLVIQGIYHYDTTLGARLGTRSYAL